MTEVDAFAIIPRTLLYDDGVPADAKVIYLVLSAHVAGKETCWPSHKRIAKLSRVSVSTVKRRLDTLRELGYVDWINETRENDNGQTSNRYWLTLGQSTPSLPVTHPPAHTELPPSSQGATEVESLKEHHLRASRSKSADAASTTPKSLRDDVERLCDHLADEIARNDEDGKRPTVTQRWRDAARLLIDRDGRTEEKIHRAIDWCQSNEFWRSNILSMPKLREKYAQLQQQAQRDSAAAEPTPKRPQW